MTLRLEKLQRQRALLQEHLRWLESEIAEETDAGKRATSTVETGVSLTLPEPAVPAAQPSIYRDSTPILQDEIVEPDVRGIHSEVRSGCLLYFGLACAAVGLIVALIYWRY